jgi:calcineurin-like phosphoesterase family protein
MRRIWIIRDTHFNHKSIIDKFEFRKPWFEKEIIRKIKNNVLDWDTLIHLWDVIFDRPSELWDYLKEMGHCTKILVRGNHDRNWVDFYLNKWFNLVVDEFKIKEFQNKYNILFTHIPRKEGELEAWYINIHWHLHTKSHHITEYTSNPKNYLLYSAEKENFMPILLWNFLKRLDDK